ncbi:MAG: tetraacyldisaccharide 4'-kinase [Chlamydiia bacterium]|nr:tetraacyldisaccharide 4'-kinase [Chlamydiia bacterium]
MRRSIEAFYFKVIKNEESGILSDCLRGLLWLASFPYRLAIKVKNTLYDQKILASYAPPIPMVISIGNIVAGGAGKTPVTLLFAENLYEDYALAVLARGYRSEAEKRKTPVVLSRGSGPVYPASYAGDEAFLTSERLPKAIVVVGKDRKEASTIASKLGAQVALLDDALQHRKLARDKEVVVINLNDPWGLGHHLPRGLLREGDGALKRADLVVLNHAKDFNRFQLVRERVEKLTQAPVIGTRFSVQGIFDRENNPVHVKGEKGAVFCGIAHPECFFETVEELGVNIICEHILSDHEAITPEALLAFSETARAGGAKGLICTEKDKVKLPTLPDGCLPVYWVKVNLEVTEGKALFDTFIDDIKSRLSHF